MFPSFLQVKLSLRDDLVLTSGSINIHHHHRQHHPPPPSSRRSYDSPSSSSPASSNNDPPPPPISHLVAPHPPPLPPHFNSPGKHRPLGVPQPPPPPPKPGIFGSLTEAAVHSPVSLSSMTVVACRQQEQIAEDSPVDDPSMKTFLGKVKAFEKMEHLARAQRLLEVQEAENARVGVTKSVQWSCVVLRDLEQQRKPAA